MGIPSGMELFVIVAVVVLLFGGKKIPELAKGLGKGIKEFKGAIKDDEPTVATSNKQIDETASASTAETSAPEQKTTTQA
jgi:sec-independent protein translocase protein TatA